MKIHSSCLVLSALVLVACGKKKDDDAPREASPTALSLTTFQQPSFGQLAWEDKCTGTMQFFRDFQKNYLPDTELTFGERPCGVGLYDLGDTIIDSFEFTLKRGDAALRFKKTISLTFDDPSLQLIPYSGSLQRQEGNAATPYLFREEDRAVGENLVNLLMTYEQWLKVDKDQPLKVFGHTYTDLVAKVNERFGVAGEGMALEQPKVRFQLVPGQEKAHRGTVRFLEADLSAYTVTDKNGQIKPRKFLNCLDLACLQTGEFTYWVAGMHLTLHSPEYTMTAEDGGPVRTTDEFRVSLDFMKAQDAD